MQPIFIIGTQRSGTSWLANTISNHSQVAAVINHKETYEGIHESAFFSHVKYHFGDLNDFNNYVEFVESFKNSDYFKLLGLDDSLLYSRHFQSYEEIFNMLMSNYCEKEKKDFWLEKTPAHSLHLQEISSYFTNCKFIAVTRDTCDVLSSYYKLKGNGKNKFFFILKELFRITGYYKHINKFVKHKKNIYCITYNDLLNKQDKTLKEICDFVCLPYEVNMKNIKFKKNSSFKNNLESNKLFTKFDIATIYLLNKVFSAIPYVIFKKLNTLHMKLFRRKLPYWFFDKKRKEIQNITKGIGLNKNEYNSNF
ncbi:Sulfotransferase domain-containing protein [Lentibacillus halodurans]|uniref:Sulfotransferase domain-containing protein n=1 Tax=Lentibacillus halodurans TaxID=237679 RepID=A0A1I0XJZ8_9BACI|nr:sulfotransferase [Lentibacillus halodurans]SFB01027.1 Sulfotransferase domain-containing protein [Lentibacillus halodurans]